MQQILNWTSENTFELADCRFTIDISQGRHRRPSIDRDFTIVKSRAYLTRYEELRSIQIKKILELGVFQGGSFVFLDRLFEPDRIVGVELSPEPIPPLDDYITRRQGQAKVYYGTSQADIGRLEQIVEGDFGGELDLIVDDASHTYELTRVSFLALFPKLRPGGLYIIEDWAWSYQAPHQDPRHPWHKRPALANLLVELLHEIAATDAIGSMQVFSTMALVWKSQRRNATGLLKMPPLRGREPSLL